ncbi:MAG: calcium/sodium antiporter [Clostridia bacterium]|nr:calcium/sodium antiporter [Clostridia bacterium]MDE7329266.1 calcium/sodium antiporter [Clostridia bacterium]
MEFWSIAAQASLLIVGFVMLIKGADWFVDGASLIARKFGIPQIVIGLTIVAFGTSAPEAAISITSAVNQSSGIAIGNILGSNIMNVLLILGLCATVTPLAIQKNTLYIEIPFVTVTTAALMVMGVIGNKIGWIDGLILWLLFIIFFAYLIILSKKNKNAMPSLEDAEKEQGEKDEKSDEKKSVAIAKMVGKLAVGIALVILGSQAVVNGARTIASGLGMSESLIGLTIVAFGTSLPELVTSLSAAKKGEADLAIGNIVGSNIFNILFVLGTSSLIAPIAYDVNWITGFMLDNLMAILTMVVLFACIFFTKDKKLKRAGGITMLVLYAGYFAWIVAKDFIYMN